MEAKLKRMRDSGTKVSSLLTTFLFKEVSNDDISNTKDLKEISKDLGSVSFLYLYTNPPPMGYGTPAPKVAETVNRTREFNRRPIKTPLYIFNIRIEQLHWETETDYPFDEVTSNWHPGEFCKMIQIFLTNHQSIIDSVVNATMEKVMSQNSDVLTKGRQTWDPILERSVPSSVAYNRMLKLYKDNLGVTCSNNLEWIQCFFKCLSLHKLKTLEMSSSSSMKRKYNSSEKQYVNVDVDTPKVKVRTIEGKDEVFKYMLDLARSFCSYIKHGERGKKDRRAIASANPILRMFLHIIESFHLELAKHIPGSTISIGGDQKRKKMIAEMSSGSLGIPGERSLQATQDATKWNECVNPATFAMMHKVLFCEKTRERLSLPPPSEQAKLFQTVACVGNFLMSLKIITLGDGVLVQNKREYSRIKWISAHTENMSEATKRWFKEIEPYKYGENYVLSSGGMLMGMMNAGSTTLGLIPVMYGIDPGKAKVTTLRSSDDSMSLFSAETSADLLSAIEIDRRSLKMIGVNTSTEKTWFFKRGYGEFTSWYCDGPFLSQYGVETSTIRPQGKNPYDDCHTIAKSTAVGLQQMSINHFGAEGKLRIGIDNVRRLYRIPITPNKRKMISGHVLLVADGGTNLWDTSNCHLDEICMKRHISKSEEEKVYLNKVLNPSNPFSAEPEEEISYSRDQGCLVSIETDTPRNIFSYVRKTNRTVRNSLMKGNFETEKANASALKIARLLDPALYLRIPNIKTPLNEYLCAQMELQRSTVEMTREEEEMYEQALGFLRFGKRDDETSGDLDLLPI